MSAQGRLSHCLSVLKLIGHGRSCVFGVRQLCALSMPVVVPHEFDSPRQGMIVFEFLTTVCIYMCGREFVRSYTTYACFVYSVQCCNRLYNTGGPLLGNSNYKLFFKRNKLSSKEQTEPNQIRYFLWSLMAIQLCERPNFYRSIGFRPTVGSGDENQTRAGFFANTLLSRMYVLFRSKCR